jgi:ankyrin repeat protein
MQHALEKSIKKGDIQGVKDCIAKADLNIQTKDGEIFLIHGVNSECPEIVDLLLAFKANPNLSNKAGETALTVACGGSDVSIPQSLVAHKADVNKAHDSESLPIIKAIQSKNLALTQFLLNSNASVNAGLAADNVVLTAAVRTGDMSFVQLIANQYPYSDNTINADVISAAYDVRKNTGSLGMLDYFLNGEGSVFQVIDKTALETPLTYALNAMDAEAVRRLLDLRAPVTCDRYEIPVMHEAMVMQWVEGAEMLIAAGADVNHLVPLTDTESHLSHATVDGDLAMMRTLLAANADPNVVLKSMPLHTAVRSNSWPMVELLLQHGADPSVAEYDGATVHGLVQAGAGVDQRIVDALGR